MRSFWEQLVAGVLSGVLAAHFVDVTSGLVVGGVIMLMLLVICRVKRIRVDFKD